MLEILKNNGDEMKWDEIVKSFPNHDVYYLLGYAKQFMIHGDGEPLLVHYETDELRAINVLMKRDLADAPQFTNLIPSDTYFDVITPYGYGGFIFDGDTSIENINQFYRELRDTFQKENILCEFIRYNPILSNADKMRCLSNVIDLGKTVSLDITSSDLIWNNIESKCRNMIRKAEKSGVVIQHSKERKFIDDFISIYERTMDRDNAGSYYYFKKEFYELMYDELHEHFEIFYATFDDKIIAMSIILFANNKMHYHLSGSLAEYRNLAPSNLLLYRAACWGCDQGFKVFHLGGGIGSNEDNLYKFKAGFNRNSDNTFSIGKSIYNHDAYNLLIKFRIDNDSQFDATSNFFPLYRA